MTSLTQRMKSGMIFNSLLKFCTKFEQLYGKAACTPNMNLHCHLKEIILDYGPIHTFWCFSFVRYNGILGSIQTNNRSIELQKVTTLRCMDNMPLNQELQPYFGDTLSSLTSCVMSNMSEDGSMLMDVNSLSELIEFYQMPASFLLNTLNWENLSAVLLPSHYKENCLDRDDLQILKNVYNVMFSDRDIRLENLSTTVHKFGSIKIFNQQFGSTLEYRSKRSTGILAAWA